MLKQMMLRQFRYIYAKKRMNVDLFTHKIVKSKWIIELSVKLKTIKLLVEIFMVLD